MTDPWVEHRDLLFTVAYEMLGSAADAEDVVQETWVRWREVDRAEVRDPRAYLVRITTRLALNQLRTLARRRESYVGPWLPEPLVTTPDVAEDAELADAVSLAMLFVLDRLAPVERAVFVLREVFGLEYAEIAAAVDRSPEAVRQVLIRARRRLQEERPPPAARAAETADVMRRFQAVTSGRAELQDLLDVISPDVVLLTDGGGAVKAALQPIRGIEKVLRFLQAVTPDDPTMAGDLVLVNGLPGLLVRQSGEVTLTVSARIEDGVVTELYLVRNPAKLERVGEPVRLRR
ncbi:RNA polymerase sigma-70 factor [Ornithinimicrobium humiphilum]|uniref:RNA polymerase sigma-70 factor (ECF subfamily) n=1 Tax=Ornithinimicrobium humiphilum TaxID=125288 RepID=A0A543K855_9MICO|nr:RNA polymerase sigma-70 factor [Ornithinimicrobium humiphilum]TQM91255.1 RNA polymerase sigma-70 factor (ECF subfamily) [Ornithinimicrobium humiphilum]